MSLLAICTTIISRNVDRLTRGQYVFLLSLDLILQFFIYGIMRSIWESFILMNATGPRSGQILATMTIIPDFVNVIYLTVPKEIKLKTKSLIQKSYHLYRNPTIFAFVVFNTVVSVGIFITGVTILTLLYAKSVLSLSNAEIGLYGAGGEIITIIAVQTYGILADKFYYNTRTVYIISCFIGLFGYILYIYGTRVFQFAYVAYVLESLVVGLVKFGPLYFIDRLSMTELSVFDISIYHFSTTIVIIPGIILLGWILEFHGFVSAYVVLCGILIVFGLPISYFLKIKRISDVISTQNRNDHVAIDLQDTSSSRIPISQSSRDEYLFEESVLKNAD
eukprot:372118_1